MNVLCERRYNREYSLGATASESDAAHDQSAGLYGDARVAAGRDRLAKVNVRS
ncbi:MAG: hypothetical protein AAF999_07930 [Pseudomonadota bacterium]